MIFRRRAARERTELGAVAPAGEERRTRRRASDALAFLGFALLLPAVLLPWLVPFLSPYTLGLDYPIFSIAWQEELFFSLRSGTWPLYAPGAAGGQSASALSQGQLHHPLAHLVTLMPGYWTGHALDWNTAARLVALGWTHGVLFRFLRRLRFGVGAAFLLSLSTVYNLRALDMFRYGAALEAWTGHLLLCCALGLLALGVRRPRGPLWVVAASYWLAVSGQPQMAYYGFLGAAFFALLCPFWLASLGIRPRPTRLELQRFWGGAFGWTLCGVLLAAPFWLPYAMEFLPENAGRVGQSYRWSLNNTDSPLGVLDALLLPLRSDVHGNFGGSPLYLLALCLPAARLAGVRLPRVVWAAWFAAVGVLLFAMGDATPVYRLAWSTLPFLQSMRIPGRATLVLPVLFLVLSSWLFRKSSVDSARSVRWACACALLLLLVRVAVGATDGVPPSAPFAPEKLRDLPPWLEPTLFALTCALLLCVSWRDRAERNLGVVLANPLLLVLLGLLLGHGTWIARRVPSTSWAQLAAAKASDPRAYFPTGLGLYTREGLAQLRKGFLEPYLARVVSHAIPVTSVEEAFVGLREELGSDRVYVTNPPPRSRGARPSGSGEVPRVEVAFATCNELVFRVRAAEPSYLLCGLFVAPNWEARVNDAPVGIVPANGYQVGIPVPAGESVVRLLYRSPASLAGVAIGLLVFLALGGYGLRFVQRSRLRRSVFCVALAFAAAVPLLVRLRRGTDLGVRYRWTPESGPFTSLAYGKPARSSSLLEVEEPHLVCPSRAVDGSLGSFGAMTNPEDAPFLEIDLRRVRRVRRVRVREWELGTALPLNRRPLRVSGSVDGTVYFPLFSLAAKAAEPAWEVRLPAPVSLRFLRVTATGPSCLALSEVLVFSD